MSARVWNVLAGLVLIETLAVRLVLLDQPIVENYVGRQIPTAMVARNLDRGGSFFGPELDTAPFPNYFVVEPPIYQWAVVNLHRLSGLRLEPAGRAISAFGTTLAAAAILAICGRNGSGSLGLVSALVFSILPVTVRYGRSFQPDALAMGLVLAGSACWLRGTSARWRVLGAGMLSLGLSMKVIGVFALGVLAWDRSSEGKTISWKSMAATMATLVPVLAWYGYAWTLMDSGSRASSDNAEIWLGLLVPRAWGESRTYEVLARYFVVRAFTPVALGLAVLGLWRGGIGRFWVGWIVGAMATLLVLVAKLHHEYYWLWLAPGVAVGSASVLVMPSRITRRVYLAKLVAWGLLLGLSAWLTRSTWRTPEEWRGLESAGLVINQHVPVGSGLIATEAVLYASDRRGYRLETAPESIRRAEGEWGRKVSMEMATPQRLVGWYHDQGARYLADVGNPDEGLRTGWVEAFRRPPYLVLEDQPGLFLVKLPEDDDGDQ